MTKDTLPEDFTLSLALMDVLPVLFFGINCLLIGKHLKSSLFFLGVLLCLFGGSGKVLWKLLVVLKQRNIWILFIQMRILIPTGFLMMLLSVILLPDKAIALSIFKGLLYLPSLPFLILGFAGMCLMMVFAFKLDNTDKRSNWIEQLTNAASQICFCAALLLL